jgi:hypothetical protein
MLARTKCYALVLLAALAFTGGARPGKGAAIDPVWLAKASSEGKAAYQKYKALSLHMEEESSIEIKRASSSTEKAPLHPQSNRERIVRLGDNVFREQIRILDGLPKSCQIQLQCDNSDYHFTLRKTKEDSPYALVDYTQGGRKIPLSRQDPGLPNEMLHHLRDALAAIENDGTYTLRGVRFDAMKGLLLIEFGEGAGNTAVEDQVYVDPNHDWRVVERRVKTPTLVSVDRWAYGVSVGGLEFPTEFKSSIKYKDAKAHPDMEIIEQLVSLKLTDKTPDDFRLSAFGLPEPVDVAPPAKPTRWYLWILVVAGVSAALSFGFAYWRRRRQARLLPTPLPGAGP